MPYSQDVISDRLKKLLPSRWFGEETPILDTVLTALSAGWISLFSLLGYTKAQTRISTAFGFWLDFVAKDFFDYRVKRRDRETDVSFRGRIYIELLSDRCTRAAIYNSLWNLTARAPIIFEPANPQDTGCYGSTLTPVVGMAAYGEAGAWGNLSLPFQAFVRAFRSIAPGVAMVNGWGGSLGGFGVGSGAYISLETNSSEPSDSEIYRSASRTAAAGAVIWMSIES
jgi:hypothetical protein